MSNVIVDVSNPNQIAEARKKLSNLETELKQEYGIDVNWTSDHTATIEGKGIVGTLTIGASNVAINLQLSFFLSMMKSKIESGIRDKLTKALA